MTSRNEQRVQESLRALERADVEAVVSLAHAEIEFVNPPYAIEPGTRHGIDGLRTGLNNLLEAFEELRLGSPRVIDLGDRVVALGTWTGRGRGSSYRFDPLPYGFLITLRDDLIIRYEWFADHAEALAAAGVGPG